MQYGKLFTEYEAEQRELEEKVKSEQQEVDTYEQNKSDFGSLSAIIRISLDSFLFYYAPIPAFSAK